MLAEAPYPEVLSGESAPDVGAPPQTALSGPADALVRGSVVRV